MESLAEKDCVDNIDGAATIINQATLNNNNQSMTLVAGGRATIEAGDKSLYSSINDRSSKINMLKHMQRDSNNNLLNDSKNNISPRADSSSN